VRIAQVVPRGEQPWSGVLTVIVHLAAALAERGHDVEVWQLHDWEVDAYEEQRRRLDTAGVRQVPLLTSRGVGRAVASLAEERAVEIVHLHGAFNRSNTAVSRALRHPYVFSPHSGYDPISLERGRFRKLVYRLLFERRMLEHAAMLVALTDLELRQLRDVGARGPVAVIPNGVEPPPNDIDRRAFRVEIGLPPDAPLAVFVGRLDVHRKGLDMLVTGIADAPGWHLALVGPRFRDVERLEAMIADLGVGDRILLVGERHGRPLQETMGGADIFALMSRWEGMPMALLEALSVATPAVVSPAVGRSIDVEEAGAGWIVPEGGLAPLLRRLHGEERDELVRRGRAARSMARRYDWKSVAHRYEDLYERAVGSDRRMTP
jgi:glycosyltransferase involved in cell wall biosynthesis